MKSKLSAKKLIVSALLAIAAAIMFTALTSRQARVAALNKDQGGFGRTTGVVGIAQGQTARLNVWNKGGASIPVLMRFVDVEGKVLVQRLADAGPGEVEMQDFNFPPIFMNRLELQAQFLTADKKNIGLLVPTFQVIEDASGKNSWMIGPEGFSEIQMQDFH